MTTMKNPKAKGANQWATDWISSVADGSNTMSARKLTSIDKRGRGFKAVAAIAKRQKAHLLLFEDDKGSEVVAASKKPFKVIT